MGKQAVSFEATTSIRCDRDEIDDISSDHAIGGADAAQLFERLKGSAPEIVEGIVEAYAIGSGEDYDDGEVTAFVRVTIVMEESEDDPTEELTEFLQAVYDALKLPDSMDGDFEYVDEDPLESYVPFVAASEPGPKI